MNLQPLPYTDFIEYWSAFHLAQDGMNPYDPNLMLALQQAHGLPQPEPTMMWNPPWLLLLMAPILFLDGETALAVWRCLSVLLAIISIAIVLVAFRIRLVSTKGLLALLLVVTAMPLWHGIITGQIHALLLLAIALAIYGRSRDSSWSTAAGLAIMSIKPHLFYLVALRVIFDCVRSRNFSNLRRAALLCTGGALTIELMFPGILANWVQVSLHGVPGPHTPVRSWAVATLVYPIRSLLSADKVPLPFAPMVLVPGLTAGTCLWCWIRAKQQPSRDTLLPYLMVFSYLTSPYGWISDQLVILPAIFLALVRTDAVDRFHALIGLFVWLAMQAVGLALRGTVFWAEHHYLWLPIGTALLIILLERGRSRAIRCIPRE